MWISIEYEVYEIMEKSLKEKIFDIATFREDRKGAMNMGMLIGGVIVFVIVIVVVVVVLVQTTPQVFGSEGLNNTEYLQYAPALLQAILPLIIQTIWILIPVGLIGLAASFAWMKLR